MALLQRFYDPDAGEILLKGQPLKSLSREALRGSIGVVQQNDLLMADTIDENIRFGRRIEEAAIRDAAASAQAEFITRRGGLPDEADSPRREPQRRTEAARADRPCAGGESQHSAAG